MWLAMVLINSWSCEAKRIEPLNDFKPSLSAEIDSKSSDWLGHQEQAH